jgi:hypothetical protein
MFKENKVTESEEWQSDYDWISNEMGSRITKRRIRKLSFNHNGKVMLAEVGKPNPYNGFPLRKIYEVEGGACYLLCGGDITIAPKKSHVEEY